MAILGPITYAVYSAICGRAGKESRQCWPSYQTIAKDTGLSKNSVIRKIDFLVWLGAVKREKRLKKDGQTSNMYTVARVPWGGYGPYPVEGTPHTQAGVAPVPTSGYPPYPGVGTEHITEQTNEQINEQIDLIGGESTKPKTKMSRAERLSALTGAERDVVDHINTATGRTGRALISTVSDEMREAVRLHGVDDCKLVIDHLLTKWSDKSYINNISPFRTLKVAGYIADAHQWKNEGGIHKGTPEALRGGANLDRLRSTFDD